MTLDHTSEQVLLRANVARNEWLAADAAQAAADRAALWRGLAWAVFLQVLLIAAGVLSWGLWREFCATLR